MKSSGNSDPFICINNLLKLKKTEVPYDRLRGADIRFIDTPAISGQGKIENDIAFLNKYYEPRISTEDMTFEIKDTKNSYYRVTVKAKVL